MRFFGGFVFALALLAACGTDEVDSVETTQEPSEPTPQQGITLESLDIGWQTAATLPSVDPPQAPEQLSTQVYTLLVESLQEWATASTIDTKVLTSSDPAPAVADAVTDPQLSKLLNQMFADAVEQSAPRLAAANLIAPDVTLTADPAVDVKWHVLRTTGRGGKPVVDVTLQTRAAYPVQLEDGSDSIIGLIRDHTFRVYTDGSSQISAIYAWEEFGSLACAPKEQDLLRPETDLDEAMDELDILVQIAAADELYRYDSQGVDIDSKEHVDECADRDS